VASQADSIQKAGHQVTTVIGRKGVETALKQDAFDLVLLGPTLTRNDRHTCPTWSRNHTRARESWSCTPTADGIPTWTPLR